MGRILPKPQSLSTDHARAEWADVESSHFEGRINIERVHHSIKTGDNLGNSFCCYKYMNKYNV